MYWFLKSRLIFKYALIVRLFLTSDQSLNLPPSLVFVYVFQTSAVLCSGGCSLLAVSSLLAIITIFLPSGGCERRICTLAGYMQMTAGEYRTNTSQTTHTLSIT